MIYVRARTTLSVNARRVFATTYRRRQRPVPGPRVKNGKKKPNKTPTKIRVRVFHSPSVGARKVNAYVVRENNLYTYIFFSYP